MEREQTGDREGAGGGRFFHHLRPIKTEFQQGRSERRGEAYIVWYVEPLSERERC